MVTFIGKTMYNLTRFGRTTSLKGVPRAISGESNILRLSWTVAVVAFLCLGFLQVGLSRTAKCKVSLYTTGSEKSKQTKLFVFHSTEIIFGGVHFWNFPKKKKNLRNSSNGKWNLFTCLVMGLANMFQNTGQDQNLAFCVPTR